MTTAIVERPALDAKVVEQVLLGGDLSKLTSEQRLSYYRSTCESLGLNPLTKPFDYLTLNGKTILYARKDATEQLRKIHGISVTIKARETVEGCYVVTAQARMVADGREDESIGAVPIANVQGEARSNAMMKAETKAKRRVTLSICGLGMLDETEVDSIPHAQVGDPLPPLVIEAAKPTESGAVVDVESGVELPKLPEGCVYILKVERNDTSTGKARWKAEIYDGTETKAVTIWDQQMSGLAEQIAQDKQPALIALKAPSKWGQDVKNLARYAPEPEIQLRADELPAHLQGPELTDADIPF